MTQQWEGGGGRGQCLGFKGSESTQEQLNCSPSPTISFVNGSSDPSR